MPVQAVFRDLEGTKLLRGPWASTSTALPGAGGRRLTYDAERGWDRVVYCLLVNHLAEIAAASPTCARAGARAVAAGPHHVARCAGETPGAPAGRARLRALLAGVPLPAKANLPHPLGPRRRPEAGYVPVPNPLADRRRPRRVRSWADRCPGPYGNARCPSRRPRTSTTWPALRDHAARSARPARRSCTTRPRPTPMRGSCAALGPTSTASRCPPAASWPMCAAAAGTRRWPSAAPARPPTSCAPGRRGGPPPARRVARASCTGSPPCAVRRDVLLRDQPGLPVEAAAASLRMSGPFGMDPEAGVAKLPRPAARAPWLRLRGMHAHLASGLDAGPLLERGAR